MADDILRRVARARRTIERAVGEATAGLRATGGDQSGGVNVARRRNVVVAAISGAPDSAEVASARQAVVIAQSDARQVSQPQGADAGSSRSTSS
jgi:hypothetical protein